MNYIHVYNIHILQAAAFAANKRAVGKGQVLKPKNGILSILSHFFNIFSGCKWNLLQSKKNQIRFSTLEQSYLY